jgi:poly(beta-D-mannuronate) lyase
MSTKGQYQRTVTLGSTSLGLLKLASRPGAKLSPEVREWLLAVAQNTTAYHSRRKVKNNLFYWAGAAAAATSLVTGDESLWRFAANAYDTGMDAIREDGTLPFELARGQRATSYHSLAAGGLVLLARLGRMHGDDMFDRRDGRIHRLVALIFRATQDPSLLDGVVGVKQRPLPSLPWLPLYQSAFPSRVPDAVQAMSERKWYQYLGGNVRALDRVLK